MFLHSIKPPPFSDQLCNCLSAPSAGTALFREPSAHGRYQLALPSLGLNCELSFGVSFVSLKTRTSWRSWAQSEADTGLRQSHSDSSVLFGLRRERWGGGVIVTSFQVFWSQLLPVAEELGTDALPVTHGYSPKLCMSSLDFDVKTPILSYNVCGFYILLHDALFYLLK